MNSSSILDLDYFKLFSLRPTFSQQLDNITAKYHQLIKLVHPDNFVGSNSGQAFCIEVASRINTAYQVLHDPTQRAVYLLKLTKNIDVSANDYKLSNRLLTKQFMFNEQLEEINNDVEQLTASRDKLQTEINQILQKLEQQDFNNIDNTVVENIAELRLLAKAKQSISEKLCQ